MWGSMSDCKGRAREEGRKGEGWSESVTVCVGVSVTCEEMWNCDEILTLVPSFDDAPLGTEQNVGTISNYIHRPHMTASRHSLCIPSYIVPYPSCC